jgi:hypothetical protein
MIGKIYTNIKSFKTLQFINLYGIDEYIKDNNIPTLLIGKKELTDRGYELSVLNRQIDNNLFWTYTKMEKRNIHEQDIAEFYKLVFKKLYRDIRYTNMSIYTMKYSIFKGMLNILLDNNIYKCIYIRNNHVYVYYNNKVTGFSLDEIKYVGIDITKVMNILTNSKNSDIITTNNFIKNEVKEYLNNRDYLTPYMYFISKKEEK